MSKPFTEGRVTHLTLLQRIAVTILVCIVGVAIVESLKIPVAYEEKRYDAQEYADSIDFIALISEAESSCYKDKDGWNAEYCKVLNQKVKDRAALHDLGAQETMALATRGLLKVGWLQSIALYLTLLLFGWAVIQTHAMLIEGRKTADAAEKTLKETKAANILQLKPYFSFTDTQFTTVANSIKDPTLFPFSLKLHIKNIGKTPATHLKLSVMNNPTILARKLDARWAIIDFKWIDNFSNDAMIEILNPDDVAILEIAGQCQYVINGLPVDISVFKNNLSLIENTFTLHYTFYGSIDFHDIGTTNGSPRRCGFMTHLGMHKALGAVNPSPRQPISRIVGDSDTERSNNKTAA